MRSRLSLLLLLFLVAGAAAGGAWRAAVGASPSLEGNADQLLQSFASALATIEERYAVAVPARDLVESGIRGMLRTLDPHSSFFTRRDYSRLQEEQKGHYFGLGITIRAESPGSGRVIIVEPPAPGTPSYKAGLRAHDVISRIEGQPIDDWDLNEQVIPHLKGPKGTQVTITIERPGEPKPFDVTVTRDEIPLYTIRYAFMIRPGVGYVRINKFAETTGHELEQALKRLHEENLEGLILDLRDNPGGALSQAIAVADHFLARGQVIVSTRGRKGRGRVYKAPRGTSLHYPMAVLINRNSASASEIVAGALQDHDRALIVGETSFGKALVQTIYNLRGHRGLALTTGRYYTPAQRLIQRPWGENFYDYYIGLDRDDSAHGQEYRTDTGRIVYGGGGINPDERVTLSRYPRLLRRFERKNLFVQFVTRLVEGKVLPQMHFDPDLSRRRDLDPGEREEIRSQARISGPVLRAFAEYARTQVDFAPDDFSENKALIRNRLKRELYLRLFGDVESFRVALQVDRQVQRALELLPEVSTLLHNNMASK